MFLQQRNLLLPQVNPFAEQQKRCLDHFQIQTHLQHIILIVLDYIRVGCIMLYYILSILLDHTWVTLSPTLKLRICEEDWGGQGVKNLTIIGEHSHQHDNSVFWSRISRALQVCWHHDLSLMSLATRIFVSQIRLSAFCKCIEMTDICLYWASKTFIRFWIIT